MNIMFDDSITAEVKSKYMLLELDTFYFSDIDQNKKSYCLIEAAPIQEMFSIDKYLELHANLIKNYKLQNWKYCEDVIEHLTGRWNGELDTFYKDISGRISKYKDQDLDVNWSGVIIRS